MEVNEVSKNAHGGTEQMMERLYSSIDKDLLDKFQIIPSRVRQLNPDKVRILYCHDLPEDPESQHLANDGWQRFHKIVFVSHWQQQRYIEKYQIPWSHTAVLQNAIVPIELKENSKKSKKIKLIYHTTPHRGLEIVYPVVAKLAEQFPEIHLDVFSSFKIYGWEQRDEPYLPLFEQISKHPNMTYHGYQPNDVVRKALAKAHIFAYPSIWPETSCISLIEAMSASVICVHPNLAALPETAANWTMMYNWDDDPNRHANTFYANMINAIEFIKNNSDDIRLQAQKTYTDTFYGWALRKSMWTALLNMLQNADTKLVQPKALWSYKS